MCSNALRLGAVLSSPHVAVEPSKILRAGASALFAKLDRAPGLYLSLINDVPLARLPHHPHTSLFVPGEFLGSERTEKCA